MKNSINKEAKFNQTMNFEDVTNFFNKRNLFNYYADLMFDIIKIENLITVIDIDVLTKRVKDSENGSLLINELKCSVVTSVKQF